MKKATILHLFLFVSFITTAQTYSVTYNVHQKFIHEIHNNEGQSNSLLASVGQPFLTELKKQDSIREATAPVKIYNLIYCNGVSTYTLFQGKKTAEQAPALENQSNIRSISISVGSGEAGVLYKNFPNKIILREDAIFDKPFLITDTLQPINWIIDTATKTIGKFNCTKATATIKGQPVEAWFTADIPISDGPDRLYGLPGLILAANATNGNYEATEIKINNENTVLQQPNKGTVVTGAEYGRLTKEKLDNFINSIKNGNIEL